MGISAFAEFKEFLPGRAGLTISGMDMAVSPGFSTCQPYTSSMRWHADGGQGARDKNLDFKLGAVKIKAACALVRECLTFWQAGWANIWNAVLAVRWPSPVEFPLAQRGPVPEVLLSRLLEKGGLYPKN